MISYQEKIEQITSLPTLPAVVQKLTTLLQDPHTSAEEVGKAITIDQSLASKVLKLVNSAFYGFPGRISTITHAIVILGFSTIKNIVLTASIFDAFKNFEDKTNSFKLNDFWYHSIACGAAAQAIAKSLPHTKFSKEEFFIAGLVHDIGKIIQLEYFTDQFMETFQYAQKHKTLFFDAELKLLSYNHQQTGDYLASKWRLPKHLQYTIASHHAPDPNDSNFITAAVVHAADIYVRALDYGNGGDTKIPRISADVWQSLGLESFNQIDLCKAIKSELTKANVFMQIV